MIRKNVARQTVKKKVCRRKILCTEHEKSRQIAFLNPAVINVSLHVVSYQGVILMIQSIAVDAALKQGN